ncbi:MAG: DUF1461 domain-containing protein [Candidatus Woesearchaeota archaeon]
MVKISKVALCWISSFLAALILLFILMLSNTFALAFSETWYRLEFYRLNIYGELEQVGIAREDAESFINTFPDFLVGRASLSEGIFSVEEASHLNDVKNLFKFGFKVYIVCLAGLLMMLAVSTAMLDNFFVGLRKMIFATFFLVIILGFSVCFRNVFSAAFIGFHAIFFKMGNWQFPLGSRILIFFPERFFMDGLFFVLIATAIEEVILFLIMKILFDNAKKQKI